MMLGLDISRYLAATLIDVRKQKQPNNQTKDPKELVMGSIRLRKVGRQISKGRTTQVERPATAKSLRHNRLEASPERQEARVCDG